MDIQSRYGDSLIKSKYQKIIEIIFQHNCVIFGGFLRDWIDGVIPVDMDIIKPYETQKEFQIWYDKLNAIGYTFSENDVDEQIYQGEGLITLHVIENEENEVAAENERLSPCCNPDFNVNFLAFDRLGLFNWVDMSDPTIVIDCILKKQALAYKPLEDRKLKFTKKHFEILPQMYVPLESKKEYVSSFIIMIRNLEESKKIILAAKKQLEESNKEIEESSKKIEESNKKIAEAQVQIRELKEVTIQSQNMIRQLKQENKALYSPISCKHQKTE